MNEKINEGPENKEVTDQEIEEARIEIMSIRQEIYSMGANDYEMPAIEKILDQLKKKEILPKVALETVGKILSSKQDYH